MTHHTIGIDISKEHLDVYRLRDGARAGVVKAAESNTGTKPILANADKVFMIDGPTLLHVTTR